MARVWIPRGTVLNTATVVAGAILGGLIGTSVPLEYRSVALTALGFVTVGIGIKMFLSSQNIIIVAVSVVVGGTLGLLLGIHGGMESFSNWAKASFGGKDSGHFNEALIGTSLLFCVGPMTLLGCIQDALEGKIELLAIKSTLDGIAGFFFAAALSYRGVLVTAGVVLVFQSLLTFLARPLRPLAKDADILNELSACGGIMMMGIGVNLLEIKSIAVEDYLPALVVAPLIIWASRKIRRAKAA